MINDIDDTIREMLIQELGRFGYVHNDNYEISFNMPDNQWENQITKLTINLYLFDIVENQILRNNEELRRFNSDERKITKSRLPARFDCKYLVTTWSAATPADTSQEHLLLGQVLWALFRNPMIPAEYFRGFLLNMEPLPEIPTFTARADGLEMLGQFWSSLENQWKSAFNFVVTMPMDLERPIPTGPMITTKLTKYEIKDLSQRDEGIPESREEFLFQIGGRIIDTNDPPNGIPKAVVEIVDLGRSVKSDKNGFYTIAKIPRGYYRIKATANGYITNHRDLEVPEPHGDYHIILTSE